MTNQRNLLLFALALLSVLIWINWTKDSAAKKEKLLNPEVVEKNVNEATVSGETISVKSDLLSLKINLNGGDIESASLLDYAESLKSEKRFVLLENNPDFVYVAQSGLIGKDGIDRTSGRPNYQTEKTSYSLENGQNEIEIPLHYQAENGVSYTKIFTLTRGKYDVKVRYQIKNRTEKPLEVAMYGQLKQTNELPKAEKSSNLNFALRSYRGAAYSSDEKKYKKYKFSEIQSEDQLSLSSKTGWVAMLQHYFVSAWIPTNSGSKNHFYTNLTKNDESIIGFKTDEIEVPANGESEIQAKLWIGPELQDELKLVAPNLNLVVDYGFFAFISQPLFWLLKFLYKIVGNWGLAIILITFVVRGIMYPLTRSQYTSMAKMKMLQPRIEALRERYGEDKQRLSQEMMAIYKEEKVNPLGGCLPIIVQMPIFLALFYMLSSSIELRHAPLFGYWIQDLSAHDPYYILPLIMGGTMFLIQKMSPTPVSDPMQQKIMTFMPVAFTFFFLWFPAGLVLYYSISNIVTIVQQKLIYRGLEKRGLHVKEPKNQKK